MNEIEKPKPNPSKAFPSDLLYDVLIEAFKEVLSDKQVRASHPRLLTETEAAEMTDVRPQTMAVWRSKGVGPPYVKVGRNVRYRPRDIEEYIEKNLVK